MSTAFRLALLFLVLILLAGGGIWYYLFGPNTINAADLVPADTVIFATIPNAARVVAGYETSDLKKVLETPDSKPLTDSITNLIGPKNLDLIQAFLPNLSGQSFLAVTHIDPTHLAQVGFIAGLKPKSGFGDFNAFLEKLKAAYPTLLAQGSTGAANVEGLDYQWIQGPGAPDKICVAQYRGWIITSWGEASLKDWWERLQKKASTPSLTQNNDYQKSLKRVGHDPETLLYLDYHTLMSLFQARLAQGNPSLSAYLAKKYQTVGSTAVGSDFEQGQIADHFSMLMPRAAQTEAGVSTTPCPFETLQFTSPDTRIYWAASLDWTQVWARLQDQAAQAPNLNPLFSTWTSRLLNWAQSHNLDLNRNIFGPLGKETSLQAEWSSDTLYPEVGLFVKLDKPDDFKPTINALIESVRTAYAASAVVNEINSGDQNFATLKFVNPFPISPTITESGPYLGIFLTENQAVRSFKRDASVGLLNNADFKAQIGDKRLNATQIAFVDSPQLLNRAYQTILPYLPLASMLNRSLGALLQNRTLPPNLDWLAPIDTWSFVTSSDDDGFQGYSISGAGNQGIFFAGGLGGLASYLQTFRHPAPPASSPDPTFAPAPQPPPLVTPTLAPVPTSIPVPPASGPAPNTPAPASLPPASVADTNAAQASPPSMAPSPNASTSPTNAAPDSTPAVTPSAPMDASPASAPETNAPPVAPMPTTNP